MHTPAVELAGNPPAIRRRSGQILERTVSLREAFRWLVLLASSVREARGLRTLCQEGVRMIDSVKRA